MPVGKTCKLTGHDGPWIESLSTFAAHADLAHQQKHGRVVLRTLSGRGTASFESELVAGDARSAGLRPNPYRGQDGDNYHAGRSLRIRKVCSADRLHSSSCH